MIHLDSRVNLLQTENTEFINNVDENEASILMVIQITMNHITRIRASVILSENSQKSTRPMGLD